MGQSKSDKIDYYNNKIREIRDFMAYRADDLMLYDWDFYNGAIAFYGDKIQELRENNLLK